MVKDLITEIGMQRFNFANVTGKVPDTIIVGLEIYPKLCRELAYYPDFIHRKTIMNMKVVRTPDIDYFEVCSTKVTP